LQGPSGPFRHRDAAVTRVRAVAAAASAAAGRGIALAVACLLLAATARGETTTLTAVADSYLKSGSANQNQGGESTLRIQASGNNRVLVRADPAAVDAAIGSGSLVSATLELFIQNNGNNWGSTGRTVGAHRVLAVWEELGATWNCPIDANLGNSQPDCAAQWSGGSFAGAPTSTRLHTNGLSGWVQFDVTADVAAFRAGTANHGWLLRKVMESEQGEVQYSSRSGAAGQAPRLTLVVEHAATDDVAPVLRFTQPSFPVVVNNPTPAIAVEYSDGGSGLAGDHRRR
jgi:hypothetical protein